MISILLTQIILIIADVCYWCCRSRAKPTLGTVCFWRHLWFGFFLRALSSGLWHLPRDFLRPRRSPGPAGAGWVQTAPSEQTQAPPLVETKGENTHPANVDLTLYVCCHWKHSALWWVMVSSCLKGHLTYRFYWTPVWWEEAEWHSQPSKDRNEKKLSENNK